LLYQKYGKKSQYHHWNWDMQKISANLEKIVGADIQALLTEN
jgi:hypothetical protein